MIKNIIFDIGAVLVDFDPVGVLEKMKLEPEQIKSIAENTVLGPYWKELDRGVLPKEEVFSMMLNQVPADYKENAKDFLYNHTLETVISFDYSADWLKDLKSEGYNVFLLTNYPDWMFDYHWKNVFSFTDYVDGTIVSGKEKIIKPDHKIYECILNRFGLVAEESVFIDDRQENIQAAKECGIHGIQFICFEDAKIKLNALLKK